jgi:hypothetical protein
MQITGGDQVLLDARRRREGSDQEYRFHRELAWA